VGLAGFAVVVVVAVVEVAPVVVFEAVSVTAGGVDVETELLSPPFVSSTVTAITATASSAMIAGRGVSIRVAVGTVWVERSLAYCVFGTSDRMP
jgi:hypothetical protein